MTRFIQQKNSVKIVNSNLNGIGSFVRCITQSCLYPLLKKGRMSHLTFQKQTDESEVYSSPKNLEILSLCFDDLL